jgi:hypothetical protein
VDLAARLVESTAAAALIRLNTRKAAMAAAARRLDPAWLGRLEWASWRSYERRMPPRELSRTGLPAFERPSSNTTAEVPAFDGRPAKTLSGKFGQSPIANRQSQIANHKSHIANRTSHIANRTSHIGQWAKSIIRILD